MAAKNYLSQILTLNNPRSLTWETLPLYPSQMKPTELLAKTRYSAVSTGTEIAAYKGLPPLRPGKQYPRVNGYCNVAEVTHVGIDVSDYQVGDYILTFQSHRTLFLSDQADVICKIPEGVDLKAASTTYLFHLGYHAILTSGYQPGHTVGIVGLGLIGLGAVAIAAIHGADVSVFSEQQKNINRAVSLGAKSTYCKTVPAIEKKEWHDGLDIIITTSNSWSDWLLALDSVRKNGTVMMLGFPGRGEGLPDFNPLDSQYVYDKQLTIRSCGMAPDHNVPAFDIRFSVKRNCQYLLGLILTKKLNVPLLEIPLIPYSDIEQAYQTLEKRKNDALSFILEWE